MSRFQQFAASLFIAAYVTLGLIDATPVVSNLHARVKSSIDPFLDATGLWQGDWRLFAPEPRKVNVYVSATFIADGVALDWHSPRWTEMSVVEKFFYVRHMKFYDGIRLDENRAAWSAFADYRVAQLPPTVRSTVTRVELRRHWRETPPPNVEWTPGGTFVSPNKSYAFFARDLP